MSEKQVKYFLQRQRPGGKWIKIGSMTADNGFVCEKAAGELRDYFARIRPQESYRVHPSTAYLR